MDDKNLSPDQLWFRYQCTFRPQGPGIPAPVISPHYEKGEQCPEGPVTNVRSYRLELSGSLKSSYVLQYSGDVAFKGASNPRRHYDTMSAGEWLGTTTSGGAPEEWIAHIKLFLRRD